MKILITGANGFLGNHLVKKINQEVKNDKSYHTSDAHPTSKAHKEFAKILGNEI